MLSLSTMSTPTSPIKATAAGAESHCTRLRARCAISSGTQKDKGGLPTLRRALPLGLNWDDVQRFVASFVGESTIDLRNRAMIMLLVVYGLRRGEVVRLRLEDIDWCGEILHVNRPKQRCTQQYPLVATVGNAILRYLKEARPRSAHRELFLSVEAPIRPLSPGRVSGIVRSRLTTLGIDIPRRGAHCLRHANARHLLDAGFALKEIGDHLGHRSASSTRIYAKVDLTGLRCVAEIDLGSLL
jgi:site-specific recombinase XerD